MNIEAIKEDRQGKVPFEFIKNTFKDCDPMLMAELSGTIYDKEKQNFIITLMGKDYVVSYPSGEVFIKKNNEIIDSYVIKTTFLRYLVNAKGVPPTGRNITYKEIPGGHVYYSNFYHRTILMLVKTYGNNIEAFIEAGDKLKAEKIEIGDAGYRFQFLNNIYLTFILWRGDDEIAPSGNILFDLNTPYYFNAEDLAVVGDIAIAGFEGHGDLPSWRGVYKEKPSND